MSEETNVMKVDSEKIKEVLRHHNELTQQLHYQIIDIQKKIEEVKKQSIEVAAYPHIEFSARGKGGVKKDLADVYLKYQKMVRNREKELTAEILILTADESYLRLIAGKQKCVFIKDNRFWESEEIEIYAVNQQGYNTKAAMFTITYINEQESGIEKGYALLNLEMIKDSVKE